MDLPRLSTLLSIISLPTDPLLERFARLFRFRAIDHALVSKIVQSKKNDNPVVVVDFGCGQDILLYKYMRFVHPTLIDRIEYVGVDPLLRSTKSRFANVTLIKSQFEKIKLHDKADLVVLLAVLEHVDDDTELLTSAARLLGKKGKIIGTTPSPLAKHPLEFLAYRIGTISAREIEEHKRYPTKEEIESAVLKVGRKIKRKLLVSHHYFELGMNNYFEIRS